MSAEESKNGHRKQNLTGELRQYIEKRFQLFSLTIAEQVSRIAAESFLQILGMFIMSFALFFFWFAIGFWVGEQIGSISGGFAISSIPLFLLGFLLMRRGSSRITERIQAQLISKVIDDLDSDEEPEKIEGKTVEQK